MCRYVGVRLRIQHACACACVQVKALATRQRVSPQKICPFKSVRSEYWVWVDVDDVVDELLVGDLEAIFARVRCGCILLACWNFEGASKLRLTDVIYPLTLYSFFCSQNMSYDPKIIL